MPGSASGKKTSKKKSPRALWYASIVAGACGNGRIGTWVPQHWPTLVWASCAFPYRPAHQGLHLGCGPVAQEYVRFHRKQLHNPQAEQRFRLANDKIAIQDYESAALLLENVSQEAAVPVVFNNLGVVYAQLN
jgi:hypothetical protein